MQDPIDAYVARLLEERGEPDDETTHQNLTTQINDAIDQALIEALPLAQLDKLEQAAQSGEVTEELMQSLLDEANVSSEQIVEKTLATFHDKYLKGEK